MEKRNIVDRERTPGLDKSAEDSIGKAVAAAVTHRQLIRPAAPKAENPCPSKATISGAGTR